MVLVAYLALAALYNAAVPLGEGPDEAGHAAYAFFLARERRLPLQAGAAGGPARDEVPGEGHQPPLAYILAAPAALWLAPAERSFDLPGNPRFVWLGGGERNAAAHGTRELWPYDAQVWAWRLMRGVSALAGAATVALTFALARRICPDRPEVAVLAAALVAFNPQVLFLSALVSNDLLLAALCMAVLVVLSDATPHGRQADDDARGSIGAGRQLLVGALLGLALLTKQSAMILLPLVGLWAAMLAWRGGAGWGERLARLGSSCLLIGLPALAICGWWYLRNWRLYGDPLGLAVFRAEFASAPFAWGEPRAWLDALWTVHRSSWGVFGWMNLPGPDLASWIFAALCVVGVLALALTLRGAARADGTARALVFPALLLALGLAWLVSFALAAGQVAWQGRLLFPAAGAAALLLALGLGRLARGPILWLGLAALALYALWLPFGVIRPAYPPQVIALADGLALSDSRLDARLAYRDEPGAALRAARFAPTARASETVRLTLVWQALSRQNRDWEVFVHLVDADGTIVAEVDEQPRGGALPMTQWVRGDWLRDEKALALPANLAPGTYELRVGLWYPKTERRAGVYDSRGKLRGDYVAIGKLTIDD